MQMVHVRHMIGGGTICALSCHGSFFGMWLQHALTWNTHAEWVHGQQ